MISLSNVRNLYKLSGDGLLSEGDGLMSATNKNKINYLFFIPKRSVTY